jgi:SnoaL-like domain
MSDPAPAPRRTRVGNELVQKQRIRELLENWVIWRDQGAWDRFATCWHTGARMLATWFDGPADHFIEASRKAFDRGVTILHALGGSSIDVAHDRAVASLGGGSDV